MRALYALLAAGVVLWAVLTLAEVAERQAGGRRRPARAAAAPAPAAAPAWPARPKGKGVLLEKDTGRRYETP